MDDINEIPITTPTGGNCKAGPMPCRAAIFAIIGFILLGTFASHAAKAPLPLKIGYFQNEPIVFKDHNGSPQGLYVDIINEIARLENWDPVFVFGDWNQCIRRLDTGKIDLMTSIARNREREKRYAYSRVNLLTMWGQVYARTNSDIEDILDLRGRSVAVLRDGINGINFKKMVHAFGIDCRLVPANTYEDVARFVADGRVAACVLNNVQGRMLQEKFDIIDTPIMSNPFKLLFAAPKESPAASFLGRIDDHLKRWKADKKSIYYQKVNQWYGYRATEIGKLPQWAVYVMFFGFFAIVISVLWVRTLSSHIKKRQKTEREKERLIVKLQNALTEIKTLQGIVPICAKCKNIRDDRGYWNLLETYIEQHSDASFSHGLCPDCTEKMYGNQEWYQKMKQKRQGKSD
ncbi:MAG TPA: hypothetical protein DHV36_10620 [Desulfobacteraceae bacterium]|nr:hypothetical protein [Desulfobacteraceae bacterium]